MDEDDNIDQMVNDLIAVGAIEVDGIDPITGEFLYKVTEKMELVNKDLYNAHLDGIYADTMYFWERGFLEIDDITNKNPIVALSPKCFDLKAISDLPSDRVPILMSIIKALDRPN